MFVHLVHRALTKGNRVRYQNGPYQILSLSRVSHDCFFIPHSLLITKHTWHVNHQRSILLLDMYAVRISPRSAFLLTVIRHGFPQRLHAKVGWQPLTSQFVPTLDLTLRYTSYVLLSHVTTTTNHHHTNRH